MSRTKRNERTEVRNARKSLRRARRMLEEAEVWDEVKRYALEVPSSDKYEVQ